MFKITQMNKDTGSARDISAKPYRKTNEGLEF